MAPSVTVSQFYAGKSIFLTGCTGFMGKVLVEKLLRCCPDVYRIYCLLRTKKGQGTKERLDDFINSRAFEKLRSQNPKCFEKIRVVPGDILVEELGLSNDDREELQREVDIVFHCAACVRFDMCLRDAVRLNVLGTQRVLTLADGMKKLQVFVHVSTAYNRCELPVLEEQLYQSKHRPRHVLDCVGWMDDDLLNHLEPKMIEPQPNTYAYTKSLTEDLVAEYEGKFPIVIARPSIVTAAYKEPFPGWVDNLNGPTGLLVGAGKGAIRTMHCNEAYLADIVPVDMVINGCLLLAYSVGLEKPEKIHVCNITEGGLNPLQWGYAVDQGRIHVEEYPFSITLWYPGGSFKSSRVHHEVAAFFTHWLPAYFIDLIMFLTGNKTFMIKVQKKISYGLEVLQYYTTKQWLFKNENFQALRKKICKQDDETFYTDIKEVNWSMYIKEYIRGAREYCLKEDPATLPQSRRMIKQLYYLDRVCQVIFYFICMYFFYSYAKMLF